MPPKKGECDVKFKNFSLRWTGYKESQFNALLIGQWVATHPNGTAYFAGTNGKFGKGIIDTQLDIYAASGMRQITIFSTAAEKEKRKQDTLARFIEFLGEVAEDPLS